MAAPPHPEPLMLFTAPKAVVHFSPCLAACQNSKTFPLDSSTVTKTPSVPVLARALSGNRHRPAGERAQAEIPFGALHCVVRCVRPGAIDGNAELHQVGEHSGLGLNVGDHLGAPGRSTGWGR